MIYTQRLVVEPVNDVKCKNNQQILMLDCFKVTVLEVLEAAQGFRVKAKECVRTCV